MTVSPRLSQRPKEFQISASVPQWIPHVQQLRLFTAPSKRLFHLQPPQASASPHHRARPRASPLTLSRAHVRRILSCQSSRRCGLFSILTSVLPDDWVNLPVSPCVSLPRVQFVPPSVHPARSQQRRCHVAARTLHRQRRWGGPAGTKRHHEGACDHRCHGGDDRLVREHPSGAANRSGGGAAFLEEATLKRRPEGWRGGGGGTKMFQAEGREWQRGAGRTREPKVQSGAGTRLF